MTRRRTLFLLRFACIAAACTAYLIYAQIPWLETRHIHTEPSDFAPVVVLEEFGQRCMNFNTIRAYIERMHKQGKHYDMIMLDAFDEDYIPPHLLTYAAVFGDFFNLRSENGVFAGNRVIIAMKAPLPDQAILNQTAKAMSATLAPFGIQAEQMVKLFSRERDWAQDAELLTD